jgi:hypothetical protein
MAWSRGRSGNPAGRPPSEKAFANLLNVAVREQGKDGVPKLRRIVDQLVKNAVAGEAWAIQQVADRLDGKPALSMLPTVQKRDAVDWTTQELKEFLRDATPMREVIEVKSLEAIEMSRESATTHAVRRTAARKS